MPEYEYLGFNQIGLKQAEYPDAINQQRKNQKPMFAEVLASQARFVDILAWNFIMVAKPLWVQVLMKKYTSI